ncbi:hypothetical protein R6Q59_029160 [Mikania micrantha]
MEVLDESVSVWRRRYEGRLLATRQIVEKIESSEDENTFDFKMDFIVLFMTILVECHKNGRVKEGILRSEYNTMLFMAKGINHSIR